MANEILFCEWDGTARFYYCLDIARDLELNTYLDTNDNTMIKLNLRMWSTTEYMTTIGIQEWSIDSKRLHFPVGLLESRGIVVDDWMNFSVKYHDEV